MNDEVQFVEVKDDARYEARTGKVLAEKRYTFYIGTHGPFVERVPAEPFDATEIERRVQKLKTHLATLPR